MVMVKIIGSDQIKIVDCYKTCQCHVILTYVTLKSNNSTHFVDQNHSLLIFLINHSSRYFDD